MLTEEQEQEIEALWVDKAQSMGFAVTDIYSWQAFEYGYAIAKGWL